MLTRSIADAGDTVPVWRLPADLERALVRVAMSPAWDLRLARIAAGFGAGLAPADVRERMAAVLRSFVGVAPAACAERVSETLAEVPALLANLEAAGFTRGRVDDERQLVGALMRVSGIALGELVGYVAGEVIGDAVAGVEAFDRAAAEVWGQAPAFWRDGRRIVHGARCGQADGFLEAVDAAIGGPTARADGAAQAEADAYADSLARFWHGVERPTEDLGPALSQRIGAERRASAREAAFRRRSRLAPHLSRDEDHAARALRRPDTARAIGAGETAAGPAGAVDARDALARLLDELSPDERALLQAVNVDGLSYAAAGRRLGVSDKTAKAWHERLVRKVNSFREKQGI